ncbi:MmcQ/YjbR family DNA-binding protein [Pseudooceanicola sp. 216_PA32_1]|uniref:MmcQ/YjbR family DNA-binding protein n=1 Tax=Pseudooceanicola pacificus TaxID=2676438 RepID=A0A844WF13_9RHOB|nr:MmcQ/YjbR family DNA-binding protein [Pseudooceanicola pacificus]MWB79522.1 MmcQ/YjbR family DNA-binding protein [Pseudooceanicola pacificus]
MTRATVNAICKDLPGAEVSDPWGGGHDAWKVGGKMFACIGAMDQGVAVKTADPDFAAMMIENGDAVKARYFHRSWVLIEWGGDPGFLRDRILVSYDLIRSKLPKKLREELAARDAG